MNWSTPCRTGRRPIFGSEPRGFKYRAPAFEKPAVYSRLGYHPTVHPFVERTLAVAVGGAFGAVGRYWLSGWVSRLTAEHPFPFGTLTVNLLGAILLGILMGATASGRVLLNPTVRTLFAIGVLGAFTTFSTFAYENIEALRLGDTRVAFVNVSISLVAGLLFAWIGLLIGERL